MKKEYTESEVKWLPTELEPVSEPSPENEPEPTTEPETASEPNIAFVGGRLKRRPIECFTDGMDILTLPEDQSKPFFHEEALRICSTFPELYKPVVD